MTSIDNYNIAIPPWYIFVIMLYYCIFAFQYKCRSFNLIDSETFSLTNACALFNALSTEDQYLSFEGFVAALQDISYKLYGKNSCKDELQQILKHCKMFDLY